MARRVLRRPPGKLPPAAAPPAPPIVPPAAGGGPPGPGGPAAPPALTPQQILVNNEQVKLTANLTNAVAGAFIIGAGAGAYSTFGAGPDITVIIGRAVFWIGVGILLHWVALRILRNLL